MTSPTTPNLAPKAKRARKKVTTDLGRQLLTRERQRLSREQAALAEQQTAEAQRRRSLQKAIVTVKKPIDGAIARSIVKRFAAVLASEGIDVRIIAKPSTKTSAWTDFEQIVINYREQDDHRMMAANMRGLAYHEGGHCRFTLPFLDLAEAAGVDGNQYVQLHTAWNCLEDQRMETAVTSDSPRKAAYLTTMVMQDLVPSVNHAAANWPLLIWRRYLPVNIRKGARKLFVVRHGAAGENIARELERVTSKYVLATDAVTMWEAVVEYHGLLSTIQPMAARMDDASAGHQRQSKRNERDLDDFLVIPVDGGGEGGGIDADEVDWDDIDQTDPEVARHLSEILIALWNAPETLICVIYAEQSASKGESDEGAGSPSDEKGESGEGESDEGESDEDEDGSNGSESGEGRDDDGKSFANESAGQHDSKGGSTGTHKNKGVRDDLDYEDEDESTEGEGASDEDDDDLTDEALQEARQAAEAERDSDKSLDQDVKSLSEAINEQTSALTPYETRDSDDAEAQAAADNLAQDIEQAFQENTIDRAPGWLEGQRRGFVNVLRYETRRPGDVEFFRAYTETDAPGTNISVSVLLDYSASMGGATKELAQAGYACKKACDNLDIPCTVVLWDTNATTLWDANERCERLPVVVATGGTDPSTAMADLDNQRYDKDIHIVLVMTDGAWSGACANGGYLASYKGDRPGRYFIGLGYADSSWGGGNSQAIAENLRRYGCDESHGMENLMEIPRYLEEALLAFS